MRVTIEVPLTLIGDEAALTKRVHAYLAFVRDDILDVAAILRGEPEVGRVKWFDEQRGYGFIRGFDRQDVFVHWSGIAGDAVYKTLREGQRVRFKRRMGKETFEAVEVEPLTEVLDNPQGS